MLSTSEAIRQLVATMGNHGAKPRYINNGEEVLYVTDSDDLLSMLASTDSDIIGFRSDTAKINVQLVYGNDPSELISDWWPAEGLLSDALNQMLDRWADDEYRSQ